MKNDFTDNKHWVCTGSNHTVLGGGSVSCKCRIQPPLPGRLGMALEHAIRQRVPFCQLTKEVTILCDFWDSPSRLRMNCVRSEPQLAHVGEQSTPETLFLGFWGPPCVRRRIPLKNFSPHQYHVNQTSPELQTLPALPFLQTFDLLGTVFLIFLATAELLWTVMWMLGPLFSLKL